MRALTALLLIPLAAPALAQDLSAPDLAPAPWRADARLAVPLQQQPVELAPEAAPLQARRAAGSSVLTRGVIPGVIGAVLGGWVGYVASQVVRSDWDKETNGEFASYRMGFAAGGAAVGAVTGVVLGRSLGQGTSASGRPPRLVRQSSQELITEEEIVASHARTGLELIQALRPRWLTVRGTNSFEETAQGTASREEGISIVSGTSPIKIYVNNSLQGDISTLRTLSLAGFTEVRYYTSAQATYKWGQGHLGGAIEFLTTVPAPM